MKIFKNAIVKEVCKNIVNGLSNNELGTPDYENAKVQHSGYVSALRSCQLNVEITNADERFPDSVFIEDTAVCTPYFALITKPGAPERELETENMVPVLKTYFERIEYITGNGTLDGGDIMQAGDTFYIGISGRTNNEGADQFMSILQSYGMNGIKVPLKTMLHLKTGVSYLGHNNLLVSGEFINNPVFKKFNKAIIPEQEQYASNSLWINDTVLVPEGFPETAEIISKLGYKTVPVDVSEFRKLDGGLSCLSLRF